MRIIAISQVFWPDTASTAQHLYDFVEELTGKGHNVTVYTSRNAYENTVVKFPASEVYRNIVIKRISNTGFGKKHVSGRLLDFFSFNLLLFFKLLFVKKRSFDIMIGMTSPPLISFIGVLICKIKKIKFFYWGMDLQPELSIASGLIKKNSLSSKLLTYMGNYIMRSADNIIALDTYMKDYFQKRGASSEKVHIVPVWPVMEKLYEGNRSENPFRVANDWGDKTVIMYSGNHSYVHPLDTLLNVALLLKDHSKLIFVFIGDGVRKKDVSEFKQKHGLSNIEQLPYQPRNNIHNSLAAADIQVVIMGSGQVGFTHPNKIYGAMFIGKPILYIGPDPSHVIDILTKVDGNISAEHGQYEFIAEQIMKFNSLSENQKNKIGNDNMQFANKYFHPDVLKKEMVRVLEEY
ncbi:MAG: glycosyltransferase family 4 protein [Chitinophagaceae bacterium]|nr:glycosyltransferase family 4 protein [Chitinophagaceae bacterium]